MDNAVAITGIGVVSPLAVGARCHFDRLLAGDSAIARLDDELYRDFPVMLEARVSGFDRRQFVPDRMLRKLLSPSSAYALAAAAEALSDSSVEQSELANCGLYVGSVCLEANPDTFIPALRHSIDEHEMVDLSRFARNGMKLIDPLFLIKSLPNSGLCAIAIQYQVLGPNSNITNGPVSGLQALIAATEALRRQEAAVALAGGYDSLLQMDCIVDHLIAGRLADGHMPPHQACRPFDRKRSGYALSEGAVFFMLETMKHARSRCARIYGQIVSFDQATSAASLFSPVSDGDVLTRVARNALELGGITASGVDAIFTDALAIEEDDEREAAAYEALFSQSKPVVTGFSGSLGFCGAATGVFSLAHALLAMKHQVVPPMINCEDSDYRMNIARRPSRGAIRNALVWTSDRGIKNAAVLVCSAEPQ